MRRKAGGARVLIDRRWLAAGFVVAAALAPQLSCAATPNAHPDFSGVWTWYAEAGKKPFAPPGSEASLPLTPEGQQRVKAYRDLVGPDDNPGAHCLGSGMPESAMFSGPYPMEIIQRPEQLTVVYEAHTEMRRWYLGAKIIAEGDRLPARNGYSTARWEGQDLIVETGSLKEQEDTGYPHSDQAHITERYHMATDSQGEKVLAARITLTDPVFYTQPVVLEKKWALDPKGILLPYECDEEAWLNRLEALQKQKGAQKP